MKPAIRQAFKAEMDRARRAYHQGDFDEAFHRLERAHILGQRYFTTHMITHLWMLRIALRRLDWREIRGQVTRIIAVVPGYLFGWVPKGNTGGANVSAVKPMPIPDDLAEPLKGYNVWLDVLQRVLLWLVVGLSVWLGSFAWGTWVRAGETRTIVSAFGGTCTQLVGFDGPEDLVLDRERGVVYGVGGDRRSFRSGGPGRAKIWSLPLNTLADATSIDLAPPEPAVFRSFGMDLHIDEDGTRRLFVANRPDDGHAIEIFKVEPTGEVVWERSLRHPLLRNPNDLVAVGLSKALVTLDKEAEAATFGEILEGALQSKTGKVLLIDGDDAEIVADGLQMANGIALSPSGTELYVGETIAQGLSVFAHDHETHSLEFDRYVPLDTGVDNITVTPSGRVVITGHPKLLTLAMGYQRSEDRPSPSEVVTYDPQTGAVERLYVDDGDQHSGGSVAILDEETGRLLIGSAFGPHILHCQMNAAEQTSM